MKAVLYHQSPTTEQKLNTNYETWQNETFLIGNCVKPGLFNDHFQKGKDMLNYSIQGKGSSVPRRRSYGFVTQSFLPHVG